MVFTEKLNEILQNQQATDEAISAVNNAIGNEVAQVTDSLTALAASLTQRDQTIAEQEQEIKDLLEQVQQGNVNLDEANQIIDSIAQKQQEQLAAQQELVNKVSAIFTPPEAPQPAA